LGVITAGDFLWIVSSEDRLIAGMKTEWIGEMTWGLKTDAGTGEFNNDHLVELKFKILHHMQLKSI